MNNLITKLYSRIKKILKYIITVFPVILLIILGISLYTSYVLTHPRKDSINIESANLDYTVKEIQFKPKNGDIKLSGWYIPAEDSNKTIIFAHGYKGNRLDKLDVAESLVKNNFNVFLFDFRNCGNSEGKLTTIGQYERDDLLGAVDFIEEYKGQNEKIGLIGYSMGAATVALAAESPLVKAAVMDSSFAELKEYLQIKLPVWSNLPPVPFNWFILNIGTLVYGINPGEVKPIEKVKEVDIPIFFIHGKEDKKINYTDSIKMYKASNNSDNQLWLVPEAGHIEASNVDFDKYIKRIVGFFDKYL